VIKVQDESTPPENHADQYPPEQPKPDQASAAPDGPADSKELEPSMEELKAQLLAAQEKANENWERCLRATAEQDNIRKRAEREVDAARRFALEKFAQDLLSVRDSLELGLKAAAESGAQHQEGAELTLKILTEAFNKHGIKCIDPKGAVFNPAQHEAISAVPTSDAAPNTVIDVLQKGYSLNERVLRPAMVIVAKPAAESVA
jgi:molecular chaperone GrpE